MARDTRTRPGISFLPSLLPQGAAVLWLAVAVLVLLSLPLFALFASFLGDVSRLQAAVVAAHAAAVSPATAEELAALQAQAALSAAVEEGMQAVVVSGGAAWGVVLERIIPLPSSGISLTGLEQHGADISLRGRAIHESALTAYVARLQTAPAFASVRREDVPGAAQGPIAFRLALRLQGYRP